MKHPVLEPNPNSIARKASRGAVAAACLLGLGVAGDARALSVTVIDGALLDSPIIGQKHVTVFTSENNGEIGLIDESEGETGDEVGDSAQGWESLDITARSTPTSLTSTSRSTTDVSFETAGMSQRSQSTDANPRPVMFYITQTGFRNDFDTERLVFTTTGHFGATDGFLIEQESARVFMASFISASGLGAVGVVSTTPDDDLAWRPNDHNGRPAEESLGLAGFISGPVRTCPAVLDLAAGVTGSCEGDSNILQEDGEVTQIRTSTHRVEEGDFFSLSHLIIVWGANTHNLDETISFHLTTEFAAIPLPPAVWGMGAGLGLFGLWGASRRRRAKG